jgi:anaphase-promoting complex subunit 1
MVGGVIQRQWNFEREGEPVQWACIGSLVQERVAAISRENKEDLESSSQTRPTFGPFVRVADNTEKEKPEDIVVRAIFIFLRSIGKIYLDNGVEYVISLPFVVQKAWPASPHGVILQRMFEPNEKEEAIATGEPILPTVFSLTNPFNEAVTVGIAESIKIVRDGDTEVHKTRRMIPSLQQIVHVSHQGPESPFTLIVTANPEEQTLHIWRYVYARPSDMPQRVQQAQSKPLSMPSTAPSSPAFAATPTLPQLGPTTTMESLMKNMGASKEAIIPGSPQKRPEIFRGSGDRRASLIRNEVSMALDRDAMLHDRGRMKPAIWLEKLYSEELTSIE